jgi:hypothetical protein
MFSIFPYYFFGRKNVQIIKFERERDKKKLKETANDLKTIG